MFFQYKAMSKDGNIVIGRIEAGNVNMAVDTLSSSQMKVIEIKPIKFSMESISGQFGNVDDYSVAMMTRRLATMILAGLPMARALFILYDQEDDRKLKLTLQQILHDIRIGSSLSWAVSKHHKIFSNVYTSMIRVGEATGEIGAMLNRLSDFLERDIKIRRKAKSAMTYPSFIFAFCVSIVAVIFIFILPNMMEMFIGMNVELPLPTRVMIQVVNTVRNPYVQIGLVLGVVYYIIYFRDWVRTAHGKYGWDRLKLTVPVIKEMNKKFIISNFSRALGVLLSSGVPLIKSLEVLMEFLDNEYFKQLVVQPVYDRIREGQAMSQVLADVGFFPNMATQMVAVGESTGELPTMLNKISQFYDMEIEYALESFLAMIEPIMIGVMGMVVAFVLVSVFLPLYAIIMKMA